MMRQAVGVLATVALIAALIGIWVRLGPVATEAVTAAGVHPSAGAISPLELMSRSSTALPSQYYRDPF
jgi:hypothetical protein